MISERLEILGAGAPPKSNMAGWLAVKSRGVVAVGRAGSIFGVTTTCKSIKLVNFLLFEFLCFHLVASLLFLLFSNRDNNIFAFIYPKDRLFILVNCHPIEND